MGKIENNICYNINHFHTFDLKKKVLSRELHASISLLLIVFILLFVCLEINTCIYSVLILSTAYILHLPWIYEMSPIIEEITSQIDCQCEHM